MAGRRPDVRLVAKNKETGEKAEVGVGWENDYGGINIKPVTEEANPEGGMPKLPLADVCDPERFFINQWPIRDKDTEDDNPFE